MVRKMLRRLPLLYVGLAAAATAGETPVQACLECHRKSDAGLPLPWIEGQHAAYLARELARFHDAHRKGFPMQIQAEALSPAQIDSLSSELAARPWPGTPPRTVAGSVAAGAPLAAALACGSCHGPVFRGGATVPRLAGQNPEYLARQLRAFGQGHRELTLPQAARSMKGLREDEIVALASYLGSLDGHVDLHWLAGRWCSDTPGRWSEEWWTDARAGLMLGLHREVDEGRLAGFEFLRIEIDDGAAVYQAQPGGKQAVPFPLVEAGPSYAVFANPDHDYPKRLRYQRRGNALKASVDDGLGGQILHFDWTRDCR